MPTPALPAHPTLDGTHLTSADTNQWDIRRKLLKTVVELATGGRREFYAYAGAGKPLQAAKLEVTFRWDSLGSMKETVEELLSVPGPHQVILWRREFSVFAGNGSRTEFTLPWTQAIHAVSPPSGLPSSQFEPQVKVGTGGAWLTYQLKDQAAYDAGSPGAGEVWFLEDGKVFKLETAPGGAAQVFARVVPAFTMIEAATTDQNFRSPVAEPRRLQLLEV